jgi:GTP cyclohydrolase I
MAADAKRIESLVRELLIEPGENPERQGCPGHQRVAAALPFLTCGRRTNPAAGLIRAYSVRLLEAWSWQRQQQSRRQR